MQYKIIGEPLPVLICDVMPGESLITESGSMSWMSPNMKMETTSNGGVGKALGRMFAGEAIFQNRYTAMGGPGQIAFASSFPGSIRAVNITPENQLIVQKSGFLACETGVELSVHFHKKISTGFFGGEGFIMQKLSGYGTAFIEIDGHACEYTLEEGQSMIVSSGYLAAMSASCKMEIAAVSGVKNMFLGGEGIFNTVVYGPGKVILQSMPKNVIASNSNMAAKG
ncbi:MAG: TIGR00266 family protein [Faecalibacterium sp.]|nr:TIGR00266 family protein [Ruminococcus sp.]MCM1391744.1 TIGR00266 family protein [Ruminococcus sp.]MCM1485343.1 TIGR00266 family protein [Faecalibacterium sp.]